MEEKEQRTILQRMITVIPFFTSIFMLAAIALTYYTYFYDVTKNPQLTILCGIEKIYETEKNYIILIKNKIKNESKSRVEVIANLGKLYGLKCRVYPKDTSMREFGYRILDSAKGVDIYNPGGNFGINRNFEHYGEEFLGFYQPIHNASHLQPQEAYDFTFTSIVPKTFDLAMYVFMIDYSLNDENIITRYEGDGADVNYKVYSFKGKDSTNLKEVDVMNDPKSGVLRSGLGADVWLNNSDSLEQSISKVR